MPKDLRKRLRVSAPGGGKDGRMQLCPILSCQVALSAVV
jgi:hypothetical protein